MGKLSKQDILKLAQLARLDLSEAELDEYAVELSAILQYVEQLQQIDVEGLLPTNQVTGLVNVYREDEVHDYGYEAEALLANLPNQQAGLIKVKRMIG